MKLLMVARRFPPDVRSGTETVFENLWLQARARHEVRLVAGWLRDRSLVPSEALGVELKGRGPGLVHLAMWRAAAQEARAFRPDVVLANSIEVPVTRWPTACIVHDLNFGKAKRTSSADLREWFYRLRAWRLDRVITPSRATRDALVRAGVSGDKIEVIANGVDLQRFHPADVPRAPGGPSGPTAGRESALVGRSGDSARIAPIDGTANPTRGEFELAYPARITPGKGQHLAIDAVARLPAADKKRVHLRIVGAVDDRVYFDQLKVQAYKQPVTFHPDVEDIVPFYQRADLVLFPTLMREGFGYTAIEAMACARPVVWSEQPAIREATGGLGFPVPPDDATAIREVIRGLVKDPAGYRAIGTEGRAFVEERYAWDRVWGHYERVLKAMIT